MGLMLIRLLTAAVSTPVGPPPQTTNCSNRFRSGRISLMKAECGAILTLCSRRWERCYLKVI